MQQNGFVRTGVITRQAVPLPVRFFGKLVLEVLPAALASVIGGFLFTQYQFGQPTAPRPAAAQAAPVSADMIQLVRDEHAMIVDLLKAQKEAEKTRLVAANEEEAHAATDTKVAAAIPRRAVSATAAPKHAPSRSEATAMVPAMAPAVVPAQPPLVIARVDDSAPPVSAGVREHGSFVEKTVAIKDRVLAVTLHAVTTIGGIPSWIGHRLGGDDPAAADRSFSTAS